MHQGFSFCSKINMRTKTIFSSPQSNKWNSIPEKTSCSTLLIPKCHMDFFQEKLKLFQNKPAEYLSYLLRSYRFLIRNGVIPKHSKLEVGYQQKGQELRRVDFIPFGVDWAELKSLKAFLNKSMTWIFVYLLVLDSLNINQNLSEKLASFVVPKISKVRLMVKVIFSRKRPFYSRLIYFTRDRAG